MLDVFLYALAVSLGLVVLVAGVVAALRLIPRSPSSIGVSEQLAAHTHEINALRLDHADLVDKYETAVNRAKGRKRKRDDDDDHGQAPPPATVVPMLEGKDALRQKAGLTG